MTDNPVELDEHRGMAAQKLTEIRRRLLEVQADQAALRRRQEEFESHALAAPRIQATQSSLVRRIRECQKLRIAIAAAQPCAGSGGASKIISANRNFG
jgi:hypothetical protein